jgi:hypothetical protein
VPSPLERSLRRLAAHGLFAALLVLAPIPAYLAMDPSWRAVAARLWCALIVVAGCLRLRRGVARSMEGGPSSALDTRPPVPPAPEADARFLRLREDLVLSGRSRRYFDAILWPRLLELAGGDLGRPAEQSRPLRRGPSLSALASLIAEIEKRA